jgi:hypothetical protein
LSVISDLHEKRKLFDYKFNPSEENIYTFLGYFPDLPLIGIQVENVTRNKKEDYLGDENCKYIALFFINTSGVDFQGGHIFFSDIKKQLSVVPEKKSGIIFNSKDKYTMSSIKKGKLKYIKVKIF